MGNIEVEVRGEIKNFDKLLEIFRKKAKFIQEKKRLSFIYFRAGVSKDVNDIKDEKVDLRARITNKKGELIMKYGSWGGSDSRREISLPLESDNFEEGIDFLKFLGWNKGVINSTDTFVFNYKAIEFALVKNDGFNYFEAEKIAIDKNEVEKMNNEIKEVCNEFNLELFNEEELMNKLNALNNIKGNQFDFSKQKFSFFKEKFKEYF